MGTANPPQYGQPPDGPPQYEVSPIPDSRPPQQPKKRSSRWFWITPAIIGGLVAFGCIGSTTVVALSIGSSVRQAGTVTNVRQAETVTNLNDNGLGSLRYAVDMTPAGGTITFDPSLRGTILLTSGDLNIAKGLTIRGPGARILSISGGKSWHVVVNGILVTISGLTFENSTSSGPGGGPGGGGIANFGSLTLSNSTVSGNTSGGPGVPGGGIVNYGTLTLSNSTVSGNTSSGPGGGIVNFGGTLIKLNKSTVSGNTPNDISPSP